MRVGIVGIGAIGGVFAQRLVRAGHEVSVFARGLTLAALRTRGLAVSHRGETTHVQVRADDDAASLGVQDVVIVAVKAQSLPAVAGAVRVMMDEATVVVPAMNGVPWWFFERFGGPCTGMALEAVDPGGRIAATIPARQVLGCVVHMAARVVEAGVIDHVMGERLIVGEPAGEWSGRSEAVAAMLAGAGFVIERCDPIQREVWYKLWGNMTMNPVSAFTGATSDRILDDDLVRAFCSSCMREAAAVGAGIGIAIEIEPEERHQITRRLGAFKTSMLQDVEAGRSIELDALVTVVRDIAQRVHVPTPSIDALLGLTRLFARERGLYA